MAPRPPCNPGWLASYAYSLAEHVALEGDLSGHYRSNPKDHRYHLDVGPRVMFRTRDEKVGAYGHLMIGFSHIGLPTTGDTSFSWVVGGGAEYGFSDQWAGRFQVDLGGLGRLIGPCRRLATSQEDCRSPGL